MPGENFLKGAQVKSEIEAAIAYANAPSYTITVDSGDNSGVVKNPAGGETAKKVTDVFSVKFEPYVDYEFLYWKVIDSSTQNEISNEEYIILENFEDPETKCTFVKAPENEMKICLVPVVAARPQVLSYSPILAGALSVKDMPIQVVFDHDMDESSIYYSEDEIAQLRTTRGISDQQLLKTVIKGEERCYGYVKDESVILKNISITDNTNGQNINTFFGVPYFETKRILIIPTNPQTPPLNYEKIMVNLEKNFSYTCVSANTIKSISMPGCKKWIYQVGYEVDDVAPTIEKCEISVASDYYSGNLSGETIDDDESFDSCYSKFKFVSDNAKLCLNCIINDFGCGPAYVFNISLKKIFDENYNRVLDSSEMIKTVEYKYTSSQTCAFDGDLDLGILENGAYAMNITFSDKKGKSVSWVDYLVKDEYAEKVKDLRLICSNTSLSFTWAKPSVDVTHYEIKYTNDEINWNELESYTEKMSIAGFDTTNAFYLLSITAVDMAGNKSAPVTKKFVQKYYPDNSSELVNGAIVSEKVGDSKIFTDYRNIEIQDLYVCNHEVTQSEYEEYMTYYGVEESGSENGQSSSSKPYVPSESNGQGEKYPVYYVNWYEAVIYCNLLSKERHLTPVYYITVDGQNITDVDIWASIDGTNILKTDLNKYYYNSTSASAVLDDATTGIKCEESADGYRLPTEAEWEYIAREANTADYTFSGSNSINDVGWSGNNSGKKTHEVKTKNANILGVYDMSGNVWEWCYDWYGNISASIGSYGPLTGNSRIRRGGGAFWGDDDCKVSNRRNCNPASRDKDIGFRVVRTVFDDE